MAPFYTIRPVKATGAFRGSFQTLDSAMQRKWHGVCSLVFMNKNLISTALAILALSAAAASAVAQDVNAKAKASASVSADIERRGNQIRREQQEQRRKTMAAQKRINQEARLDSLHSLHSRADVDASEPASTSTEGSAISR